MHVIPNLHTHINTFRARYIILLRARYLHDSVDDLYKFQLHLIRRANRQKKGFYHRLKRLRFFIVAHG